MFDTTGKSESSLNGANHPDAVRPSPRLSDTEEGNNSFCHNFPAVSRTDITRSTPDIDNGSDPADEVDNTGNWFARPTPFGAPSVHVFPPSEFNDRINIPEPDCDTTTCFRQFTACNTLSDDEGYERRPAGRARRVW